MKMSGISKRHFRRLVKKQKDIYINKLQNKENSVINVQISATNFTYNGVQDNELPVVEGEPLHQYNAVEKKTTITEKLKNWYMTSGCSRNVFENLLVIFKDEGCDVPLTLKSFNFKKESFRIKKLQNGSYIHFGICYKLRELIDEIKHLDNIEIDVNVDGIPLFKSSRSQLWPILIKINNFNNIVFPVGIFWGNCKPTSLEDYFHDFITEFKNIEDNGVVIGNKKINVAIRAFICDTPAKAFICGIPCHTASAGCTKCNQTAKRINNVLTYETECGITLSDNDFTSRKYKSHHKLHYQNIKTPLESLSLGMITQFPIDPMHLIHLGVMKKMLLKIVQGKTKERVKAVHIKSISNKLQCLKPFVCKEFMRKPRTLEELSNWKATEFRQFLLYTGLLVFKDEIDEDLYYQFMLLHCSCRILSCTKNLHHNLHIAQNMIELFVRNFPIIFGENSVSYNVHGLLHICECVEYYGRLDNFSAFPFENYLQNLKKHVRKPTQILQQLAFRIQNENVKIQILNPKISRHKNVIFSIQSDQYYLSFKSPDNYCCIAPYTPIQITGFQEINNNIIILGRKLLNIEVFFNEPVHSINILGISLVNSTPAPEIEQFEIQQIILKFVCFPYGQQLLMIPLLHHF